MRESFLGLSQVQITSTNTESSAGSIQHHAARLTRYGSRHTKESVPSRAHVHFARVGAAPKSIQTDNSRLFPKEALPGLVFRGAPSGWSNPWSAHFRSARRMRRSARLVLIGHVSGLSGVACLDPFVCITLHLLVGLASLEPFVRITLLNLLLS